MLCCDLHVMLWSTCCVVIYMLWSTCSVVIYMSWSTCSDLHVMIYMLCCDLRTCCVVIYMLWSICYDLLCCDRSIVCCELLCCDLYVVICYLLYMLDVLDVKCLQLLLTCICGLSILSPLHCIHVRMCLHCLWLMTLNVQYVSVPVFVEYILDILIIAIHCM